MEDASIEDLYSPNHCALHGWPKFSWINCSFYCFFLLGVRSLRSPKIWGHTIEHILLQPQSDRLVLLATNAGGRPTAKGVLRTPPLRTAHLNNDKILAQPVTGSDLCILFKETWFIVKCICIVFQMFLCLMFWYLRCWKYFFPSSCISE